MRLLWVFTCFSVIAERIAAVTLYLEARDAALLITASDFILEMLICRFTCIYYNKKKK